MLNWYLPGGGWVVGGWEKSRLKQTQPSKAWTWAELGKNPGQFQTMNTVVL
jgi:hypothetical protein